MPGAARSPLRAVVFDLDGTLVHSAPDLHAALNRTLADYGAKAQTLDAVLGMIGDGVPALVARGFAAAGLADLVGEPEAVANTDTGPVARFMEHYNRDPATLSHPYNGVLDALTALRARSVGLAVCTNKPEVPSRALLGQLGLLCFFDAVVGGDTLPVRKPDPAPLLAALERLGAAPDAAAMVGDSRNDLLTARAAGIPIVLATFGYCHEPPASLGADALVSAYVDLLPTLDRHIGF